MAISTVKISFPSELLRDIDDVAKSESRTRSEIVGEAARFYIQRKQSWNKLFSFGNQIGDCLQLSESDVAEEIASFRAEKRESSN